MALSAPRNTLSFQRSRPLTMVFSQAELSCSSAANAIISYMGSNNVGTGDSTAAVPEVEAFVFYALNHAASLVSASRHPLEPLDDDELGLVESYYENGAKIARRAFYYLLLICIREARHTPWKSSEKFLAGSDPVAAKFIAGLTNNSYGAANQFLNDPPDCTLGTLVTHLSRCFLHGGFTGSFGGVKWHNISEVLRKAVYGEVTPEVMVDTVWTLAHNTGAIFNKGMLYTHHSSALECLLDVQRAGSILAAYYDADTMPKYVFGSIMQKVVERIGDEMETVEKLFDGKIEKTLNWEKIVSLGAVGTVAKDMANKQAMAAIEAKKASEILIAGSYTIPKATTRALEAA